MGDVNDATENNAMGRGPIEDAASGGRATGSTDEVMDLLAEHVPLALLADLAAPSGKVSTEILESEGLPDDAWWEIGGDAGTALGGADPAFGPATGGEDSTTA